MFEINNNLFGYINKSNDLTEDIIQRYKNSLIFIGDEKQIYVPAVNSYVGVGQSIINNSCSGIYNNLLVTYVYDSASICLANVT